MMARIIPIIDKTLQKGAADNNGEEAEVVESLYEASRRVYPRSVSGSFASWRIALVVLTQLVYYGLPWLVWNGRQAVLFDLVARKFYIFGLVLWPQDVIYLALLLVISALSLFLFTAVAGRLFCGYACPQTVYTEIFMWVERVVEGDRSARMRLDAEAWSWRKLRKKATKQGIWIAIAVWTGITFVGYFTPISTLIHEIKTLDLGAWQWFWIGFYSFATWGNAGYMREQVCKHMCPYARFQSVMFDQDTWIISYDPARGEPRGSRSRHQPRNTGVATTSLGDCIDCTICVQVCPTGIDIRNGLQYECIGCAACIDACDQVMEKMNYPKGLIRYSTERTLMQQKPEPGFFAHLFRPRILIYTSVLCLLVSAFMASLIMRKPFRVDVLRDRRAMAREVGNGYVENIYRLQLMNNSEKSLALNVSVSGLPTAYLPESERTIYLKPVSNLLLPFTVRARADAEKPGSHKIQLQFEVKNEAEKGDSPSKLSAHISGVSREEETVFILPE